MGKRQGRRQRRAKMRSRTAPSFLTIYMADEGISAPVLDELSEMGRPDRRESSLPASDVLSNVTVLLMRSGRFQEFYESV